VVSKEADLSESNTLYAQGGIVETGLGDSPDLLEKDIIRAGNGINNLDAVRIVASEGPRLVDDYLVQRAQVPFEKTETGDFDRTQEGAHSVRRILHVKDTTGHAIGTAMLDLVRKNPRITLLGNTTCVDIITNTHHSSDPQERYRERRALGAYLLNNDKGEIFPLFAAAVILATGGVGNVYLHTSNPESSTGDGIAMADRAGCEILNAEYVQFHPTVLFHRDIKRFLITEAMRGEGARLRNREGQYFMPAYNAELKDLAPRDEVARAIYREMGFQGGYVLLDATTITHVDLATRFPSIYKQCKDLDIDLYTQPIPVVPAAHYFCGGVKVDSWGQTEIAGLFAVGETACTGVHGANRLASVSLLEALVYGVRAGEKIAAQARTLNISLCASVPDWIYPQEVREFDPMLIQNDMTSIQTTMWNYVGIIRTPWRLSRAVADLQYLSHRITRFYEEARLSRSILELRNAMLSGLIIANAALKNRHSLGCHFVETLPPLGE
jgi:L-aspartate oxidase